MHSHDSLNVKVNRAISMLPNAGYGLFAKVEIPPQTTVCTYGGLLIAALDAKYKDPTYIVDFELGHGFKLIGDDLYGDLGCYANGEHHSNETLKRNAKFAINKTKKILPNNRGVFKVVSTKLIKKNEEIIINYGASYWSTVNKWNFAPIPVKPQSVTNRDERATKRRRL